MLSEQEREKTDAAIKKLERETSGEIIVAVAHHSTDYFSVSLIISMIAALIAQVGFSLVFPIATLSALIFTGTLAFSITLAFCEVSGLSALPGSTLKKQKKVREVAKGLFLDNNIHTTEQRNGLLIFISLEEHCVEILADMGINEKVAAETWTNLANTIAQGIKQNSLSTALCAGIEKCAIILAEHYPPNEADINELNDQVIEPL